MENLERNQIREEFMRRLAILQKMKSCNHVFIRNTAKKGVHFLEAEACIKCGLSKEHSYTGLTLDGVEALSTYATTTNSNGIHLDITCPIDLARSIYERIIANHPGISDADAIEYFRSAIEKIKVNKDFDEISEELSRRV